MQTSSMNTRAMPEHELHACATPNTKAQATIEYILLVCGVMLVLLVMLIVQSEMDQAANRIKLEIESARVGSKIALAINHAYISGNGTHILIYNYGPTFFNVSVIGRSVQVDYNSSHWISTTLTNRTVGGNVSMNTQINVTNLNGWIYVNQTT